MSSCDFANVLGMALGREAWAELGLGHVWGRRSSSLSPSLPRVSVPDAVLVE